MVERLHANLLGYRLVGQDQVKPVQAQLGNQLGKLTLLADHVHGARQIKAERGFQQVIGHRFRH